MDQGRRAGDVHNEFHGTAEFTVMAGDIHGSVVYAPTFVTASADPLDLAKHELARMVGAHWRAEAGIRGLLYGTPLSVRWTTHWGEYADHPQPVGGHGGDDLRSFTDAFLQLPNRRLVVLGGPGTGKSTLAIQLLLALLARSSPDDPVPVLFSLASWDPARTHLTTWLADSLINDYPRLGHPDLGSRIAARLIQARLVMPILDGLDEMPPHARRLAVRGLNVAVADDHPLVLTCRTSEYESTVAAEDVLRCGVVVHANPVPPGEALDYLRTAISPRWHPRWHPVFAALRHDPDGALATALASPLMIGLVRAVYTGGTAEPVRLLDPRSLPDAAAIETHLLDSLVPAAFPSGPPPPDVGWRHRRRWDGARAAHWLRHLAQDLTRLDTEDLTWWRLDRRSANWARSLATGLITGGTCFLLFRLLSGSNDAIWNSMGLGVMVGVAIGALFGLAGDPAERTTDGAWRSTGSTAYHLDASPLLFRRRQRIRTPGRFLVEYQFSMLVFGAGWLAVMWLAYLIGFGLSFGALPFDTISSLVHVRLYLVVFPAMSALALVFWTVTMLGRPYGHEDAATPRSGLVRGRRRALAAAALAGLTPLIIGLVMDVFIHDEVDLSALATNGVLVVAVVVFAEVAIIQSAWGRYVRTHIWQALHGRLPWRLNAFLEDAHRLGVLRQFGTGYQFRHARVRERLAAAR